MLLGFTAPIMMPLVNQYCGSYPINMALASMFITFQKQVNTG